MATIKKDGTIYIGTEIDSSELKSLEKEYKKSFSKVSKNIKTAFSDAQTHVEKFENVAGKVADSVGVAFSAMTKLVAAAGTAIGAAVGMGIEYNSQMEDYTTNFMVMLGSAEAAAEKVEELKRMAAYTPFEMSDLADATQQLLAMGVASEETGKYLQQLGDISLGDSQKLQSLIAAFGKMNSSQKVTLEYLNIMIEQGFNPLALIAEETGETMEELYDRVSEGGVAFEEVTAAIAKATAEGGQFYKGMEMASQTVSGMTSTLTDNIQSLMGELSSGIFEDIQSTYLPMAISAVEEIQTALTEEGVSGAIAAAGNVVGNFLTQLLQEIPQIINAANELIIAFAEALGNNSEGIVQAAMAILGGLGTAFLELTPVFLDLALQFLSELARYMEENAEIIGNQIGVFVDEMMQWIAENGDELLMVGMQLVISIVAGIFTAIKSIRKAGEELGREFMDSLIPTLNDFKMLFIDGWNEVVTWLENIFAFRWADIFGQLGEPLDWLTYFLEGFWIGIKGLFEGIIDFLIGVFWMDWERAWQGLVEIFDGIVSGLYQILVGPLNGIISLINGVISGINSISIDIPDWVPWYGGTTFGLNIPHIPYLATGAVIPPNAPFMAVLGDQRRGTNIEAPLSTIQQALRDVMAERGSGDPIILRVFLDSRVVYESMVERNRENTIATGENAFAGG